MKRERLDHLLASAGIALPDGADVTVTGDDPVLPARFPIGEVAAAALAGCGAQAAHLWELRGGSRQPVSVDVRAAAASLLSFGYMRVDGEPRERLNAGNPLVALYQCRDGRWVHLHGAHTDLRQGTLDVLGCEPEAESVASAVRSWEAQALEDALAERGTCGAMVRSADEWIDHPQGQSLASLPVVEWTKIAESAPERHSGGTSPLSGLRVLDLTRVLAGPTCGRTLAQHGADVLHISSPSLPSYETFDIDTGHGKRAAFVDLDDAEGARTLRALVAEADVFIDGYRTGALERRGFGAAELAERRPGIVHVSINCYGNTGPWERHPGWEQLAQSVSGVAAAQGSPERPQLVPAAACDYTTGYLAAYGAMVALARRAVEGGSWHVRTSLTQTAMWIQRQGDGYEPGAANGVGNPSDLLIESATPFGTVTHLRPAIDLAETPARWPRPTVPHGHDAAAWDVS